jgi:hypothetical protein
MWRVEKSGLDVCGSCGWGVGVDKKKLLICCRGRSETSRNRYKKIFLFSS